MFSIDVDTLFDTQGMPSYGSGDVCVSVIVTLFNYGKFLPECLTSVAAQTHGRLELIVVDDCSGDDSVKIAIAWLEQNASRFERARLRSHKKNQGLSQARNTAFAASRGPYVFVLDADNLIYPRAISRLLEALQDANAAVAYSQLEMFDEAWGLGLADVWNRDYFKRSNYVDAMALVAKFAWAEVGGYTPMDQGWEDYDLWCKFIERDFQGIFVPEILSRYRVHAASMLRTVTNVASSRVRHAMISMHPWLEMS
jgi:glycosyltransferase involved in cell wall biosynthesis